MVRSGELYVGILHDTLSVLTYSRAKYPLATCAHLLNVLTKSVGLGYDIACSFAGTLSRSSLGGKAKERKMKMVVPAFHGHAHNRPCQLSYHIQMAEGFGIEDAETCERVFSGSNKVARLTRHCTPFHRKQFIDMYFQQWDLAKYESLGMYPLFYIYPILRIL